MNRRKEERNPEVRRVMLSRIESPLLRVTASTENVSPQGMRVLTERFWRRETHLIVRSLQDELLGSGRVVYCQAFRQGIFAIGLELLARTDAWVMQ